MVTFRSLNEVKDGDSEAKISSVSGANRKRKWKDEEDEEEEQKAEESSDSDTSDDDDDDDGGSGGDDEHEDKKETTEVNQLKEPVCSSQEDKPEVVKEKQKIGKDEQNEKKTTDQDKVQNQKQSQPAVFIPVDRSPEIQVCVSVRVSKRCETNDATLLLAIHTAAFARYILTCCCRRLD